MTKRNELLDRATELVATLSAKRAYQVGTAVGSLLKDGMPISSTLASTVAVAEFIRRGQSAQQAVDAIIASGRTRPKTLSAGAEVHRNSTRRPCPA